jgi:uncharacterized membrane protein YwzB
MNAAIKASVVLALSVWVVSAIFAVAGLHEANPLVGIVLFVLFIGLTVGCVFWALKTTAAENGYGKQLMSAVVLGLIAGVLIIGFSILNLTVLFPDYLDEHTTAVVEFLEGANLPEAALQKQVAALENRTTMGESIKGGIGTFATSLIFGAIIAIFKRKK